MNPERFAAWSKGDDNHLEAAENNFIYPDDEPEAGKCESTASFISFIERITWKLVPKSTRKLRPLNRATRSAGNTLVVLFHTGVFPGQTLATLAEQFKFTKAFLYQRNEELFGRGYGVSPRSDASRENMRRARLRRIKNPDATNAGANENQMGNPPKGRAGVNGGAQ